MEEYIGKVKLNLDFYKGTDTYSDGDIEDKLLEVVKSGTDLEEFLTHEDKWEYLYHLSRVRRNVIEWYEFDPKARLLEVGAECGALTGLFCERVKKVVAVESDEKMCMVNEARNGKNENLKIVKIDSYETDKSVRGKFDYVTIIGNFSMEKLHFAKKFLKPEGKLILAIENKYGIKYWSGEARPDTYSRMRLIGVLRREGLHEQEMYYPVPDHVLPSEIYSSKLFPGRRVVLALASPESAADSGSSGTVGSGSGESGMPLYTGMWKVKGYSAKPR